MNSCYNYVKSFESDSVLPPYTWLIVRIDGRHFGRFSKVHGFRKPNEPRALALANKAAEAVFDEFSDVTLAYGHSDEYSFLLRADTKLYNRRRDKILTGVLSIFTSAYTFYWHKYFQIALKYPPSFDGRIVAYPLVEHVKDYFRWRQVDCHVNNQYNCAFWCLVSQGKSTDQAYHVLKGTDKSYKNELLFDTFNLKYNDISSLFKKGSTLIRNQTGVEEKNTRRFMEDDLGKEIDGIIDLKITDNEINSLSILESNVQLIHDDIINDEFWNTHSWVVESSVKPPKLSNNQKKK